MSKNKDVHARHGHWTAYEGPDGKPHCSGVFYGSHARLHAEGAAKHLRQKNPLSVVVERGPQQGVWRVAVNGREAYDHAKEFLEQHDIAIPEWYGAEVHVNKNPTRSPSR